MADGTLLLLMRRDESGINYVDKELYERTVETRRQGFYNRSFATKGLDSYLIAGVTISYNFTDEGLSGARQRRKRKAGCKSAQF
jgi:hypothetical protein